MRYLVYFLLSFFGFTAHAEEFPPDPNLLIEEMIYEIREIQNSYEIEKVQYELELTEVNASLINKKSRRKRLDLLVRKDILKQKLDELSSQNLSNISKVRYIKGIQIIRILYEKVLSLDHHFAAVRTFSEISKIANPNQYPEFEKFKNMVHDKTDKKEGVDLTGLLGTNTVVSVVNTFSNLMISNLSKGEKEGELKNIECILDFTLRMQNDLNTIFYETSFLHASNQSIKEELETLFKEYTKPIKYSSSISDCRANDDWDNLRAKLDNYIEKMEDIDGSKSRTMLINLEFPIDRLIQFIGRYNGFINEGEKFYQKFHIILNSYENEKQCEDKIPGEFKKLKDEVDIAIDKFNVAYRPVEVNGTKMKEILYGINEFE